MRRWLPFVDALNGPKAFTPSGIGLVTGLWFGLAVLSGWGQARGDGRLVHLLPQVVGYTLFGLGCLLIWAVLYRRSATPPSAGITVLVFVILGVFRIPLIDFAYWLTGVEPLGMVGSRMAVSVVITAQLFALVGVVGELVRRSNQSEAELWRAQQSIEGLSEAKHQAADFWRHDVLDTIERKLDDLFSTWKDTPPRDPQVVARGLLDFVSEVVRPLSHAMHSFPTTHSVGRVNRPTPGDPSGARNRVKWARLTVVSGTTMVAFCAPVLGIYALARYGIGPEVVVALMMLPLLGAGFWLTRRLVDSMAQATAVTRTALSLVSLIVVCAGATALPVALGQYWGLAVVFLWAQPIQALAVGLGLSLADYLVFHAQQREKLRLDTLERLARDSAATLMRDQEFASRAAENLHSGVQAELVAWATVFHSPTFEASDMPETLREVRNRLDVLMTEQAPTPHNSPREQVEDLIEIWRAARRVQAHVDDDVWGQLDDNPSQSDTVVKVLSEGFANAVRHGHEGQIDVVISRLALGQLQIRITNPGTLRRDWAGNRDGLGLPTISARASRVQLSEEDGLVALEVILDWGGGGDDGNRTRTISLED